MRTPGERVTRKGSRVRIPASPLDTIYKGGCMKVARNVFFGLVVTGIIFLVSGVSFAQEAPAAATNDVLAARKARYEAAIKLLQDSATALQATNPDLAMKLVDIANGRSKENLVKGSPEWKAKHDVRVELYKEASAILQTTNPDLAKGLMDMAVPWQKPEMQKMTEENNEKEAVGEKIEPEGDK